MEKLIASAATNDRSFLDFFGTARPDVRLTYEFPFHRRMQSKFFT